MASIEFVTKYPALDVESLEEPLITKIKQTIGKENVKFKFSPLTGNYQEDSQNYVCLPVYRALKRLAHFSFGCKVPFH